MAFSESLDKICVTQINGYPGGAERIIPIYGDLSQPLLGIAETERAMLRGNIARFFHVAATYDLTASAESQVEAAGGEAHIYSCDISDIEPCDMFYVASKSALEGWSRCAEAE